MDAVCAWTVRDPPTLWAAARQAEGCGSLLLHNTRAPTHLPGRAVLEAPRPRPPANSLYTRACGTSGICSMQCRTRPRHHHHHPLPLPPTQTHLLFLSTQPRSSMWLISTGATRAGAMAGPARGCDTCSAPWKEWRPRLGGSQRSSACTRMSCAQVVFGPGPGQGQGQGQGSKP